MLKEIGRRTRERTGTTQLSAEDYMDDGAKICLTVNIDEEKVMVNDLNFFMSICFFRKLLYTELFSPRVIFTFLHLQMVLPNLEFAQPRLC